ncbi:uncharacterized protein TRIADDRAFT_57413 [Trichoplax adhaerens]|uniref:Uncharacterized protein n=1 Tax=Trichoplax adhaerens TaxID=10228 RepID=B3RZD6_TRIAD|nr:hypothetical protein TRIADDRAFT_57413 [Trichoplax adhaerens]EDV24182.1 hypothetical protein TRIADDRAFT_57413 [Trichoplax adhaerens]|eukprot:XP_002113708.1 hypothetical protein TRIADDRAFT_57413 [Trichoplax adhaerens]
MSNTKQVHITQYLCFAMSAIKHAIASKFNDGYIQFMDKTWYSKAIYFKLDYHSPAYVNENLTVKSWSDASNNRINCQIMRDNDCLSTFSISFNPDLKYIPGLLPLALDVVNYDLFTITYNLDNFFHYRDRFNQPDLCKFIFAYAETLGTSVRYGIWDIPKLLSGTKGSMVLIANQCTIDPVFYTMDPDASSRLSLQLTSISNRSFISTYEIIDNQTEKVMHRTDSITVFLKDGKPEVFPDSFKETLLRKVPFKISAEKPQPLFDSIPSSHYTYHRKVRFSDLDFNDHAGYANLATFCMDAASNAISSKSSAYKLDFGQDFNPSCVRQINFVCRSQLFPDDEFAVDTWQGSENNTLYFNVRQGNKMICQSEIVIDPQSICRSN